MKWNDDTETKQSVSSWKDALVEGTKHVLSLGLPPNALPKASDKPDDFNNPRQLREGLYIETLASAETIMQWLSKMLHDLGKPRGYLQIITKGGKTIELPTE